VASLIATWKNLAPLEAAWANYRKKNGGKTSIEARNIAQQTLRATFDPFFTALHDSLKQIDKAVRRHEKALAEQAQQAGKRQNADRATRQLKTALEALHTEVKNAESSFGHIHWLQERFPEAKYEDVTGLCKLANRDEIKEQDYSLNPGRYVGVVIEEDGKTEEEFVADLISSQEKLSALGEKSAALASIIAKNIQKVAGE